MEKYKNPSSNEAAQMQIVVYELGNSIELDFGKSVCLLRHSTSVPSLGAGIYDTKN